MARQFVRWKHAIRLYLVQQSLTETFTCIVTNWLSTDQLTWWKYADISTWLIPPELLTNVRYVTLQCRYKQVLYRPVTFSLSAFRNLLIFFDVSLKWNLVCTKYIFLHDSTHGQIKLLSQSHKSMALCSVCNKFIKIKTRMKVTNYCFDNVSFNIN